jgi:uncharacterized protein YjiS (DUF1127 family)
MPDRLPKDIGVSRHDALREARKPFGCEWGMFMPNEPVLTGTDHTLIERDKTQNDGARMLPPGERAAVRRLRGRFMGAVLRDMFWRAKSQLRMWRRHVAESNELRTLSDRELRDFGISRYDAEHAAKVAFWKADRGRP